jgi:hypothetical protein
LARRNQQPRSLLTWGSGMISAKIIPVEEEEKRGATP